MHSFILSKHLPPRQATVMEDIVWVISLSTCTQVTFSALLVCQPPISIFLTKRQEGRGPIWGRNFEIGTHY